VNGVRAEFIKSTSTRMVWGLLAGAIGFTLLNVVANVFAAGQEGGGPPLESAQGLRNVFGSPSSATVFVLMLGVLSVSGEFRHGTITTTFLAEPQRARVLGAKLVALPILSAGFAAAAVLLTVVIAIPLLAIQDVPLQWAEADVTQVLAGSFLAITLYPVLGVGFAALVRNQVAAVISALVWVLVAESVTLAVAGATLGWLLAQVAMALAGTWLPAAGPIAQSAWTVRQGDGWIVVGAVAAGILAALWPAWQAYRLDVAATLADA